MQMPRVSIVIPARNEAGNLPSLIAGIEAALANESIEIIVVDDGSSDASVVVVSGPVSYTHLTLPTNREV